VTKVGGSSGNMNPLNSWLRFWVFVFLIILYSLYLEYHSAPPDGRPGGGDPLHLPFVTIRFQIYCTEYVITRVQKPYRPKPKCWLFGSSMSSCIQGGIKNSRCLWGWICLGIKSRQIEQHCHIFKRNYAPTSDLCKRDRYWHSLLLQKDFWRNQ
jgi:hypothetical protein